MPSISRHTARTVGVAALLALGLAVTACGKKGNLEPPEGATLYQNTYPSAETYGPDANQTPDETEQ